MGTNYYHRRNVCPTCHRPEEEVHIGKSSAGWTFSFHGTEEARSWEEWREILRAGGQIRDEYGDVVSLEDFERLVASKVDAPNNHTTYCRDSDNQFDRRHAERHCWLDPEGHSFSAGEFS